MINSYLVRFIHNSNFGLYRGQILSRNEINPQLYNILFDDPNIGLQNINDYDVMVRHRKRKRKRSLKKKNPVLFIYY